MFWMKIEILIFCQLYYHVAPFVHQERPRAYENHEVW